MTLIRAHFFGTMLALAAIFAASAPAMAQRFITQEPCTANGAGVCTTVDVNDLAQPMQTIRSLSFTTHGPGKALVEFDGTASCSNISTSTNAIFNFDTQIVTNPNAIPDGAGRGGAHFSQSVGEKVNTSNGRHALNLHSSRVITIAAAGPHSVYLRLRLNSLTVSASCDLYQNRFTVLFLPSKGAETVKYRPLPSRLLAGYQQQKVIEQQAERIDMQASEIATLEERLRAIEARVGQLASR